MNKRMLIVAGLIVTMLILSACMAGTGRFTAEQKAGFFTGIWHGWIAPIALIWRLFDPQVRIYEFNNTGWFYDLGFYIAVISGFGSVAVCRRRCKD